MARAPEGYEPIPCPREGSMRDSRNRHLLRVSAGPGCKCRFVAVSVSLILDSREALVAWCVVAQGGQMDFRLAWERAILVGVGGAKYVDEFRPA
jgi:hypothetical protein